MFTLALGYMFWKSRQTRVDLSSLHIPSLSQGEYELTHESRVEISEQVIAFGESLKGNESRIALLKQVGQILDVGYEQLNKDRLFNLLSKKELEEVRKYRVDIEMHTHRHTLPENQAVALKEIRDNRAVIEPLISKTMRHFCYPSGVWSTRHWQPLQQAQILTATTCETGLVDEKTPVLAWPRIVDSSRVSQLEFEAEISGFNELIRSLRSHFRLSNRKSVSNASNIEAPETTAR